MAWQELTTFESTATAILGFEAGAAVDVAAFVDDVCVGVGVAVAAALAAAWAWASAGDGRSKTLVSSLSPRPCGAAEIWQMKRLATAARWMKE